MLAHAYTHIYAHTQDVDLAIEGLCAQELQMLYRGLSVALAHKLSRARTEAIRVSECKAFNDRQTVLMVRC